ncbi:MAG: PIN domain-containing protein [archaeon]
MTDYLIDSSAWVEYFDGTAAGEKVKQILEDPLNSCYTCRIVVCEVTSQAARKNMPFEDYLIEMKTKSHDAREDVDDYYHTGIKHAELKKIIPRISYTDALLITLSEKRRMKIVSKDAHLKGKNTLLLR